MICQRPGCGHESDEHERESGPCNVKHPDGTHCVCYQFQKKKHFRIYCGPTITRDVAHRLSLWDVHTYLIGTEHIYVETDLSKDRVIDILGRQGGWRDSDIHETSVL